MKKFCRYFLVKPVHLLTLSLQLFIDVAREVLQQLRYGGQGLNDVLPPTMEQIIRLTLVTQNAVLQIIRHLCSRSTSVFAQVRTRGV